jgi:hypothetical protein
MRAVKWVLAALVLLLVGAFLHYVLPKREVATITSAYNRFVEPGEIRGLRSLTGGDATAAGRPGVDVFFINARGRDGDLLEFRNEDTGFGFPFYFKFDSATLHNQAQEAVSTSEAPNWVAVRYYGWRIPFLSMFPNAVSIAPVESRDVRLIPWFNIVLLTLLGAAIWAIWARLRRWRARRRDPVAASWEPARARRGWFGRG